MAITVNGGKSVFNSTQTILLFQGLGDTTSYPIKLGTLAPNTVIGSLYTTGDLLALYGDNAPTPALVGTYVNYDPASSNDDQKVLVGAISGQFVNGVTGVDTTSVDTATNTYNAVNVLLFSVGVKFYENALTQNNTTSQINGFNATFDTLLLDTCEANGAQTRVLKIIGVK